MLVFSIAERVKSGPFTGRDQVSTADQVTVLPECGGDCPAVYINAAGCYYFAVSLLYKILYRVVATLAIIVVTVYVVRAFDSRRMPNLGPEHRIRFASEFSADQEAGTDWAGYLAIEEALTRELEEKVPSAGRTGNNLDRYLSGSFTDPARFDGDWNRSFELTVPSPRGTAVLLHGLSDSPYTMLSTAQTIAGAGYNVVVPRMPGHGFAVGGLLHAGWEDWVAATRVAIRHAVDQLTDQQDFIIVGYSNGALIALNYALLCNDDQATRCPDKLIFLSAAISVSPAAAVANWHAAVSWMPYFEKFQWLSVFPEIDPFKFTSFPKRTAWEIHKLAKRTHKLMQDPKRVGGLPPVLTFQSVVDNTVSSRAVVDLLYDEVADNGGELVVYDVNRNDTIVSLMRRVPDDPAENLNSIGPLNYGVTILRNRAGHSLQIDALRLSAGDRATVREETDLSWPLGVYSLSHIAIPFRTDDPLYGDGTGADPNNPGVVLGDIAPRGEIGVLLLTPNYFLRTRYNPFYKFQADRMRSWLLAE